MRQLTDHKARQDRQVKGAMQVQGINLTLQVQIILLSHLLPSVGSFTTIKTLCYILWLDSLQQTSQTQCTFVVQLPTLSYIKQGIWFKTSAASGRLPKHPACKMDTSCAFGCSTTRSMKLLSAAYNMLLDTI